MLRNVILSIALVVLSPLIYADESSDFPLQLLRQNQFALLEKHYQDVIDHYQYHAIHDYELVKEFNRLKTVNKSDQEYFDQWVKAFPQSYAAWVLRGKFFYDVGWKARGDDYINNVPQERITEMESYLALSKADFEKSISLTQMPYYSYYNLLLIARNNEPIGNLRNLHDKALAIDPDGWKIRQAYFKSLRPRWGGSYELMLDYLEECKKLGLGEVKQASLDAAYVADRLSTKSWQPDRDLIHGIINTAIQTSLDISSALFHASRKPADLETREEYLQRFERDFDLMAKNFWTLDSDSLQSYLYETKADGRVQEREKVLLMLIKASPDDGNAYAQLAFFYIHARNLPLAWQYDQKGAELGDAWAQYSVGLTYYNGCKDIQLAANPDTGLGWIKKSADQQYKDAMNFLATHNL